MTYDSTTVEAARTRTFGETLIRCGAVMAGCLAVCACAGAGPGGAADAEAQADLREALMFHASFDGTVDAEEVTMAQATHAEWPRMAPLVVATDKRTVSPPAELISI